jgi:PAS domain S-box-containing protein
MPLQLTAIWKVYKLLFRTILKKKIFNKVEDTGNWREKIFKKIILYATPLSLLALLPSVIVLSNNGHTYLAIFDVFILLSIPLVALNSNITPPYQRGYVVLMLYALALVKTIMLGSFGIGAVYLLALSVFITLLFPVRAIFLSVITNIVIYASLAIVINYKLFNSPLISNYTTEFWIFYSSNFMFLNLAIVVVVYHIIIGLEKIILQQANLRTHLQNEVKEKNILNAQLTESVGHYKSLFFSNPSPMWIYEANTLRFIQVNGAAIRKYGFTRAEFNAMTIKDIRPAEDVTNLMETLNKKGINNGSAVSVVVHMGKNGKPFYAEVRCSDIVFQGKTERLVIARDISEQIQRTQAIETQNKQLREIAYLQSHIVRAPLSRILGLVNMLNASHINQKDDEVIQYLNISAKELDDVIRAIIDKTDSVEQL